MHAAALHLLETQLRLQQSAEVPHDPPACVHIEVLAAHVCVAASQSFEQQSAPVWHRSPKR